MKQRNEKSVRLREKMKTLEERKKEKINLSEICIPRRYKNKKIMTNYDKLQRWISQKYSSSYKQASRQAKK